MKACLNCGEDYEPKRESSKFCSTNCRVRHHQKHGKSKIKPFQMQAMFNSIMEAVNLLNAKNGQPEALGAVIHAKPEQPAYVHQKQQVISPEALMHKYVEERRECQSQEEFVEWCNRLDNDNRLSTRQKQLVKNTN